MIRIFDGPRQRITEDTFRFRERDAVLRLILAILRRVPCELRLL
jgi:hypothetical protein